MTLDEVKNMVLENINLEGIAFSLIDDVLETALQKVVMDSSNPFDDMLMATVYPILEVEMKKALTGLIAGLNEPEATESPAV